MRESEVRSGGAGLTLIEFLFATSIMAFVALGVAGMFPAALRSVMTGGQMTKATTLAQKMADVIRTDAARVEGFNALIANYNNKNTSTSTIPTTITNENTIMVSGFTTWRSSLTATGAQASGQGLPGGVGTIAVTCINANGTANSGNPCPTDLRRVTVTVTWGRPPATGQPDTRSTISVVMNAARPN